ncbi:hypothetical protein EU642_22200 [Salmonella enterica]|nr:hypothetical protein [Salmonella enterica]EAO0118567.1 hypothetical protein [Salmonella enterica]EAO3601671.1 hypothetical protein [Salmonella enterica]EAR6391565.1 hypothetical protein [Salmonella enterica]EAV1285329.1 hypothetical protein [Salmonella enterica]
MSRESVVQKQIWSGLGMFATLFRVNTGRAWLSGLGPKGVERLNDGGVFINAPRPIAIGFSNPAGDPIVGTADLNGWTTIEITPAMVGKKVAVFTSIETKRTQGGRTSPEQMKWCDQVTNAGGIAFVANDHKTARDTLLNIVHSFGAKVWNHVGHNNKK